MSAARQGADILISSELLADARPEHISDLRNRLADLDYELDCFYLVRNPEDWYLAAYQQHVKRHGADFEFEQFCREYAFEFALVPRYDSALGEGEPRIRAPLLCVAKRGGGAQFVSIADLSRCVPLPEQLRSSTSWKLTAPMRAISGMRQRQRRERP